MLAGNHWAAYATHTRRWRCTKAGPVPAVDGVVRWRRKDGIQNTVGRELKALGFAKISARPRIAGRAARTTSCFRRAAVPAQWIPDNITVLALPPRSPELNPVENVWQFMRDNWLSNRIFKSYEDIVARSNPIPDRLNRLHSVPNAVHIGREWFPSRPL